MDNNKKNKNRCFISNPVDGKKENSTNPLECKEGEKGQKKHDEKNHMK